MFSIQSFRRRPRFLPQFRAPIDRPHNLFFPFRARTATADFPPLTQPFKNEIKKNQVSCFEIEGKSEEGEKSEPCLEKMRNFVGNFTSEIIFCILIYNYSKSSRPKISISIHYLFIIEEIVLEIWK